MFGLGWKRERDEALENLKFYERVIAQKDTMIEKERKMMAALDDANKKLDQRVREVEYGVERDYKISIRNEVTEVIVDFTKIEMSIMLAALANLIKTSAVPEDLKIYISLNDKILGFINDMKEDLRVGDKNGS